MTSGRILTLIFFAFTLFIFVYSFQYSVTTRFGPVIIGIPTAILILVQIIRENFGKETIPEEGLTPDAKNGLYIVQKQDYRPYLEIAGCLVGLLAAIYLVGLVIAYAMFIIVYLKFYREGWLFTIALSLGIVALIYVGFYQGLGVFLYKGILLR